MLVVENKSRIEALVVLLELVFVLVIRKFLFAAVETSGIWEWFLFSLAFFLLMPWLTVKYVFHRSLADYFWQIRWERSQTIRNIALILLVFGVGSLVVLKLDWTKVFPVFFWVQGGWALTVFIDVLLLGWVVLATEFFFRGFLLSSLERSYGRWWSILSATLMASGYSYLATDVITLPRVVYWLGFNLVLSFLASANRSIAISATLNWIFLLAIDLLAVAKISH